MGVCRAPQPVEQRRSRIRVRSASTAVDVAAGHDQAVDIVSQDVEHTLGIGRDRRQAAGHGLDQGLAEALGQRREQLDLVAGQGAREARRCRTGHDCDPGMPAGVEVGEHGGGRTPVPRKRHSTFGSRQAGVQRLRRVVHALARDVVADDRNSDRRGFGVGSNGRPMKSPPAQRHDMAARRVGTQPPRRVAASLRLRKIAASEAASDARISAAFTRPK